LQFVSREYNKLNVQKHKFTCDSIFIDLISFLTLCPILQAYHPVQLIQVMSCLFIGRRLIAGSAVGGIGETQAMLDFCGEHNISCMVETIPASYVNTAMERLDKSDVKYRFVLDIANTLEK
jgi:D-arabinose 1-dehydrogenase-like Zn-dependent alcohol dehydrogenase